MVHDDGHQGHQQAAEDKEEDHAGVAEHRPAHAGHGVLLHMDVLLQRLFYFSKLEMGNLPLFPEFTDLRTLAARFVRDNQAELASSNCEMVLNCPADTFPVRIDTEQMYRVLTNLLDNALRYGGNVVVSTEERGPMLAVIISDNGPGIPEADLEKVFEPFYRVERSRNRSTGGTGLGLSIARSMARLHDGDVILENRPEGGLRATATFRR